MVFSVTDNPNTFVIRPSEKQGNDIMFKSLFLGAVCVSLSVDIAFAQSRDLPGRQLDVITAPTGTTTLPGFTEPFNISPVKGIFWDERCASVEFTFNTNQGANEGTPDRIDPNVLANVVQRGLNRWNRIPTSYIEMNVTNRTDLGNRPRIGGDFINEVTFITVPGFDLFAESPSTALLEDTDFITGEDLDGDGDADVYDPVLEGQNICTDIDNDGDIEFPAGYYQAGTILDNDVQFSSTEIWELIPTGTDAVDVDALTMHEFGHSHGLNHSPVNQISSGNGSGATMFPFINAQDPNSELAIRTLHIDEIAASSQLYPEGQGTEPITQLQTGDVAFSDAFAIVTGSVTDVAGTPIAGAAVSAIRNSDGAVSSLTYSGQTVVFQNQSNGSLLFSPPPESFVNGNFELAVPINNTYEFAIEALDGQPVAAGRVSLHALIGEAAGQTSFTSERWDSRESAFEITPDASETLAIGVTDISGVDFVLNEEIEQSNAGSDLALTVVAGGASSIRYIEHFDRQEVRDHLAAGDVPFAGSVLTFVLAESTETFEFSRGALAIGNFRQNGTPRIRQLIGTVENILAEDFNDTSISFTSPASLRNQIDDAFDQFPTAELFFILDIDNIETAPTGLPIGFVVEDRSNSGTSFVSVDNGPIVPIDNTWVMELRYVNDGRPVPPRFLD